MRLEIKSKLKAGQKLLAQFGTEWVPMTFVMAGPRFVTADIIELSSVAIVVIDGRFAAVPFDRLRLTDDILASPAPT